MKLAFLHHMLKTVALWVLHALDYEPVMIPTRVLELRDSIWPLVFEVQPTALPGDGKRQAVYARAIKRYPYDKKHHIALAIELVMLDERQGVTRDHDEDHS